MGELIVKHMEKVLEVLACDAYYMHDDMVRIELTRRGMGKTGPAIGDQELWLS